MAEPTWVIAFGVRASTGGFYQNYHAMPGADQAIPVDVCIPGCPPRPEQVLDALMMLMDRIQDGRGSASSVSPSPRWLRAPPQPRASRPH